MLVSAWIMIGGMSLAAGPEAPASPAVVFASQFDGEGALDGATVAGEGVRVEPGAGPDGSPALVVDRPASRGVGSATARWALPIERLRGARIKVEARVRGVAVAEPPKPWNGVKVMLHLSGPDEQWPQAAAGIGTFPWSRLQSYVRVPDGATAAELVLGLEATTGRVTFDDVRVTVLAPRRAVAAAGASEPDRRHDRDRLRGVMIGTGVDADDLRTLARDWGANHVRWQLLWGGFPNGPADTATREQYDAWLDGELDRLARLLPVCREEGLAVLIDLHTGPGGRDPRDKSQPLFRETAHQEHFLAVWERIVRRFRGDPAVWGYDLLNEPTIGAQPEGVRTWPELALETARRIRALDSRKAIVVEPSPWGSVDGLDTFEPLPGIAGVVYSVHMYQPHAFTHQGVYDSPRGVSYPGVVAGQAWDRAAIRRALEPARRFERDFGVPIYIGEFSAIRWAPGTSARDYLRDLVDIMEESGWDWAYHAYREWQGWSLEHGGDPDVATPSPTPTDRLLLMKAYFARNRVKPTR
jgi:hypothetical protein